MCECLVESEKEWREIMVWWGAYFLIYSDVNLICVQVFYLNKTLYYSAIKDDAFRDKE